MEKWSSTYDVRTTLLSIQSLLGEPNTSSPLNIKRLRFGSTRKDLPEAVAAEELARYLDLKKLDERVYMFEVVSAYDG
ncbi:hypothetical protein Droror1_Dr00010752 [Drosera rotundifolia]